MSDNTIAADIQAEEAAWLAYEAAEALQAATHAKWATADAKLEAARAAVVAKETS